MILAPWAAMVCAASEQVIILDSSMTSSPASGWRAVGVWLLILRAPTFLLLFDVISSLYRKHPPFGDLMPRAARWGGKFFPQYGHSLGQPEWRRIRNKADPRRREVL